VTGDGKLELWCHGCYTLTPHTNLVWRKARPPCGRGITAKCSVCGRRDRSGYVIYEPSVVGTYAGTYADWEGK
jgi:hypothetical protein